MLINDYIPEGVIPYEIPNKDPKDVTASDFDPEDVVLIEPYVIATIPLLKMSWIPLLTLRWIMILLPKFLKITC